MVAAALAAVSALSVTAARARGPHTSLLSLPATGHASLFADARPVDGVGWRRGEDGQPAPAAAVGLRAGVRYAPFSWLSLELSAASLGRGASLAGMPAAPRALAGATVRASGWNASLFVTYLGRRQSLEDESVQWRSTSLVNARFAHRLPGGGSVILDVFNVFDSRTAGLDYFETSRLWSTPGGLTENFLFHPAEPRSVRLLWRVRF